MLYLNVCHILVCVLVHLKLVMSYCFGPHHLHEGRLCLGAELAILTMFMLLTCVLWDLPSCILSLQMA